jgi:hypothetical protein
MATTDDDDRAASMRAQDQAFCDLELAEPPKGERAFELWVQHAAGRILFERVRAAGLASIDPTRSAEARHEAERAVDATMYALMMLVDGASGGIANAERGIALRLVVDVIERDRTAYSLDLSKGDGMCMGFHGWREGDFGDAPITVPERT